LITIGNIEFHLPLVLLLIPLLVYAYYLISKKEAARPKYVLFSNIGANFKFSNWKTKYAFIPDLLKLLAMIFLVVAIARPRKALVNQSVKGEGIDIMLAMDISSSMLTQDFSPDRLEVSKRLAQEFIDKRKVDKIGLVVFAAESFTQCPITSDHEILKSFIESQGVGYLEDGTAIGMGLATAVNRIKESKAKSKVIILMTDGVNNKGYIDPNTATNLAADLGIKVYTIGIGSDEMAPGPVGKSMDGQYIFDYVKGEIDEELMKEIAAKTNGQYYRARNADELRNIYTKIDQLEKSEYEVAVLKKYKELFRIPLTLALLMMLLSFILSHSLFKQFP
jgi:Ca-activated chloride channel homolog